MYNIVNHLVPWLRSYFPKSTSLVYYWPAQRWIHNFINKRAARNGWLASRDLGHSGVFAERRIRLVGDEISKNNSTTTTVAVPDWKQRLPTPCNPWQAVIGKR